MNILFVLDHFHPYIGGAETLFKNLTIQLAQQGNNVTVVTTKHNKQVAKKENYKGVNIIRINCFNRYLFTLFSIFRIMRESKNCDFIHTTSYNSAIPAFIGGKLKGKKVIITFHEVWGELWKKLPFASSLAKWGYYHFERFILGLQFFRYIAVSDYTKNALIKAGIPSNKVIRIYNGINYNEFEHYKHQPTENFSVTYFSRLGISKGIDILLEGFKQFADNHTNVTLKLIIPKYPKRMFQKVNKLIDGLHIRHKLSLKHSLIFDKLLKEITHSHCAIITSHSEGFCFAAAETVALGVPLISSQNGALAEVVSGKMIAIEELNAKGVCNALGKAYNEEWVDKPVKKFTLQQSIAEYITFYKGLQV